VNPDSVGGEDSASFWASARAPRYPHARYLQRAFNPAPPEPDPAPAGGIDAVAATETVLPRAGEFIGNVEKGTGRPALTVEQRLALNLPNVHSNTGYEVRPRGLDASALPPSLTGHAHRGQSAGNTNTNTNTTDERI
jgi:hypothetical protein